MNTSDKKGFSVAALVLGIVSVATGIFFYISLPTGILAIIFSSISLKRKYANRGMALAGLITAIVGVAFGTLILVFGIIAHVMNAGGTTTTY